MFVNSPLGVSCDTNSGLGMGGRCRSCDRCGHMRSGGLGVSEEGVGLYPGLVTMRHVGVVTCVTQPVTRHEAASHPIVS